MCFVIPSLKIIMILMAICGSLYSESEGTLQLLFFVYMEILLLQSSAAADKWLPPLDCRADLMRCLLWVRASARKQQSRGGDLGLLSLWCQPFLATLQIERNDCMSTPNINLTNASAWTRLAGYLTLAIEYSPTGSVFTSNDYTSHNLYNKLLCGYFC